MIQSVAGEYSIVSSFNKHKLYRDDKPIELISPHGALFRGSIVRIAAFRGRAAVEIIDGDRYIGVVAGSRIYKIMECTELYMLDFMRSAIIYIPAYSQSVIVVSMDNCIAVSTATYYHNIADYYFAGATVCEIENVFVVHDLINNSRRVINKCRGDLMYFGAIGAETFAVVNCGEIAVFSGECRDVIAPRADAIGYFDGRITILADRALIVYYYAARLISISRVPRFLYMHCGEKIALWGAAERMRLANKVVRMNYPREFRGDSALWIAIAMRALCERVPVEIAKLIIDFVLA